MSWPGVGREGGKEKGGREEEKRGNRGKKQDKIPRWDTGNMGDAHTQFLRSVHFKILYAQ